MSKKSKYRIADRFVETYDGEDVCEAVDAKTARKIARALNAMEDKPKAKAFVFDWDLAELRFKFAAMDFNGQWYLFKTKPHVRDMEVLACGGNFREIRGIKTYPGDWRDSLQKRP